MYRPVNLAAHKIKTKVRTLIAKGSVKLKSLRYTQSANSVDAYWNRHTVNSKPFRSVQESLKYLEWRFEQYPLFREFMNLYGNHDGQVILDYGCGPGNDVAGFLLYANARKVIGVDVSNKALTLARKRIALHNFDPARFSLVHVRDTDTSIPLADCSVDYIYCQGVLHHTSNPEGILKEFHRILKPGGKACVMVYNRNSLWIHLYTAYDKKILQGAFADLTLEEAFSRNTDGEYCPISRCYRPEEWVKMCNTAGFFAEFVGGYLSLHEMDQLHKFGAKAINDARFPEENREFLQSLTYDDRGYPLYKGKHAGIGGVYRLHKSLLL